MDEDDFDETLFARQGNTFRCDFGCYSDEAGTTPTDLTGYEVRFRAHYRDTEIVRDTSDLMDPDDTADGLIHLRLTRAETRSMPLGRLMTWELEVTEPSGDEYDINGGYFSVKPGKDNVDVD